MPFQHPAVATALIERAIEGIPARTHGIHGLTHWLRVERNGLYLAEATGADAAVASLFALFHDSRRHNDGTDPGHGARGARLAEELFWEGLLKITETQLRLLAYACAHHTEEHFTDDVTIGCCWDADRLDLPRIGIATEPALLNTLPARKIAGSMDYAPLEEFSYAATERPAGSGSPK
jgi:uncharacterized protein